MHCKHSLILYRSRTQVYLYGFFVASQKWIHTHSHAHPHTRRPRELRYLATGLCTLTNKQCKTFKVLNLLEEQVANQKAFSTSILRLVWIESHIQASSTTCSTVAWRMFPSTGIKERFQLAIHHPSLSKKSPYSSIFHIRCKKKHDHATWH